MLAHELAHKLLSCPNVSVLVHTVNGMEEVEKILVETENLTFHHYNEIEEENNKEFVKELTETNRQYDLFEEDNPNPSIIFCSESTGIA